MLAYQVAFDLFENEFQQFLLNVRDRLPDPRGHAEAGQAPAKGAESTPTAEGSPAAADATAGASAAPAAEAKDEASAMEEDAGAAESHAPAIEGLGDLPIATYAERMTRLKGVLSGETPINLALQFLYRWVAAYGCSKRRLEDKKQELEERLGFPNDRKGQIVSVLTAVRV